MQWRIKPVLPVSKLIAAVAVAVAAVAFADYDPVRWSLAAVLVLALLLWALRDVVRPVRLAADAEGVTVVTGFLGRRHLGWGQIERVRVEEFAAATVACAANSSSWTRATRSISSARTTWVSCRKTWRPRWPTCASVPSSPESPGF